VQLRSLGSVFVALCATVMIVNPSQLPGRQSRHSTGSSMPLFDLGAQHRDPFRDLFLQLMLCAAEQRGNGYVKNDSKRESGAKRWEPAALLISAYLRPILTSQQKGYVLLTET
jgi:hypothetical protein